MCLRDREISQYYADLTNMHSVGVMGDERTYDYAVALRAVTTTDFMTAESYNMPWDVLGTVTSRIVNEVKHVNRVFYDCSEIDIIVADAVHLIKFAKHFYNSLTPRPDRLRKAQRPSPAILCPFRESD